MPKPKKVTAYRNCPECGDRGTKLLHLNSEDPDKPYQCQACDHHYAAPPPEARRVRRKPHSSHAWWFA